MWIAHKQIAEYLLKDSKYAFFFFLIGYSLALSQGSNKEQVISNV